MYIFKNINEYSHRAGTFVSTMESVTRLRLVSMESAASGILRWSPGCSGGAF